MDKRIWLAVNRNEGIIESCIVGDSSKAYAVHSLLKVITNCKNGNIANPNGMEESPTNITPFFQIALFRMIFRHPCAMTIPNPKTAVNSIEK